jgi:ABC-2 type transport system ATP-binding protein
MADASVLPPATAISSSVIELSGLSKNFGQVQALRDVSLSVPPGITGLLGPNGSGKSTMIKILLGLVQASSGHGTVLGRDIYRDGKAIRADVGFMPEDDCYISGISGVEMVHFAACLNGYPSGEALRRAHEVLDYCGAEEERYREVDTYSTGMRQKLKFAQALVHDPALLILDEPTSGLDPDERESMLLRIRTLSEKSDISVLISTHILPDVQQICDQAIVIAAGQVRRADSIENLNRPTTPSIEIRIVGDLASFAGQLADAGLDVLEQDGDRMVIGDPDGNLARRLWPLARQAGIGIRSLIPARTSLDDVFIQAVQEGGAADATA